MDATRRILKVVPATKVLMLSVHSDDSYVKSVISSGAMGYVKAKWKTCNRRRGRNIFTIGLNAALETEFTSNYENLNESAK